MFVTPSTGPGMPAQCGTLTLDQVRFDLKPAR